MLQILKLLKLSIKEKILSNFEIGVDDSLSNNENKLVKLLNYICFTWYTIIIFFAVTDYFFEVEYFNILMAHLFQFSVLILVQFLQSKKKYFQARVLFVSVSYIQFFFFCNFILAGTYIEFFYILIPLFSLVFLDKNWIHFMYLFLAIISFLLPSYFVNIYVDEMLAAPTTFPILFIAIFLLFSYFKNLNKKNEALLEKQKSELEQLYGFQSHFMVNLSHEIRTPLTLIKGGASQLRTEENKEKITSINNRIDNNADKIKHLVDNIIDIAKMNSDKLELNQTCFSIVPFVLKISSSFDSLFSQKGIKFEIEQLIDNERIFVNGDKIYLERAICNLIMNAQKYCSEGDSTTIRLVATEGFFRFEIKDTGCGIPENDTDKIFESFYRAKNSINQAGGSGVGLSFAKEVISLHDGTIEVKSQENIGSVFTIELPVMESDSFNDENITIDLLSDTYKNADVLLVEDNTEMQDYLKTVLQSFKVTICNNGKEALEKLKTFKPQIVITDYMMPEMNGYELVKSIKDRGLECPIIVLTASMDERNKLNFLRLGIDDYLTKPFNEEELLIRIDHCLSNNTVKIQEGNQSEVLDVTNNFSINVKNIILDNIDSFDFGVVHLADQLAITDRTLSRRLKSLTGLTPNAFIREIKLTEANKILETQPNISLKEITLRFGFKNSTHFSTLYKKRFGKKPMV